VQAFVKGCIARKRYKHLKYLSNIFQEFFITEGKYIQALHILNQLLQECPGTSESQRSFIFQNVDKIVEIHQSLYDILSFFLNRKYDQMEMLKKIK